MVGIQIVAQQQNENNSESPSVAQIPKDGPTPEDSRSDEAKKRVEGVIEGTTPDNKKGNVRAKPEGDRKGDFGRLTEGSEVKEQEQDYKGQKGKVRVGELPDGTKVVDRDLSSDGRPTIEIQGRDGKIEIRYDE